MGLLYCIFLSCFVSLARGLYGPQTDVVQLTANNFRSMVMDSDSVWLVEFFAPWCGHCKALAPEWIKAASALKGVVKVGAVDMDDQQNQQIGGQYGIRGFPTIKVFGANKNSPTDYNGARTAQSIIDSGLSAVKSMVNQRLSGGGRSGSGRGGGGGGKQGSKEDVVELTDANFEREVLNSKDLVLVEFFAPWCGHCQRLAPEWAKAASELKGKVKVCALDATVHTATAGRYQIQGYPSIKVFAAGVKDSHSVENYEGGRTASDIVQFALDRLAESIEPPEVLEIVNSEVLKTNCEEKPICVISVLPHILDSGASGRNKYLDILKSMGEKYKKKLWGWIWTEAGAQAKLEDAVGLGGFGYPAMVAVNARKMKYAVLKGPFDNTGIDEFLRAVSVGRGATAPIKSAGLPTAEEIQPWDGKDGELPIEEDIDLSDIDLAVMQNRFSTPPTILRRGRKRKSADHDFSHSVNTEVSFSSPKGATPIKLLPFSPSQFLNSPVNSSKVQTSTPACEKIQVSLTNTTLHTPGVLEASSGEDPFRTPRIRRTLLCVSPRTPTPFKNALKVFNDTKMAHTPDNFEADFNEIMKREEEESGVHLSCSGGKTSSRVRTSLEEKYAKISKTTSASTANGSEEQPSVMEQEQSSSIVECVVEDSGVVQTSVLPSPSKDSSFIKPSEIFGQHNPFATPSSVTSETGVSGKNLAQTTQVEHFLCPSAVDFQRYRRKGHPMRILQFQETPQKSAPKLDSAWEQVACGKTPDQQLLTQQAHQFFANYRPAARTLHFNTTTVA